MKTIKTIEEGKYKAIIQGCQANEESKKSFFVQCLQDDNATHSFPFKYYSTLKGAMKYANKFIQTNTIPGK